METKVTSRRRHNGRAVRHRHPRDERTETPLARSISHRRLPCSNQGDSTSARRSAQTSRAIPGRTNVMTYDELTKFTDRIDDLANDREGERFAKRRVNR